MKRREFVKALGMIAAARATAAAVEATAAEANAAKTARPNFLVFLIDDLGWADVGCYGREFGNDYYETPNIDRLRSQGMKFTNGYASCAVCSPTRAAMMTGRNPARHGITDWMRHDANATVNPATEYEGGPRREVLCPRNHFFMELSEVTIAEVLKPAGYKTGHVGKWHLGAESWYPEKQGFDVNRGGCYMGHPWYGFWDPYGNPALPDRRKGEYLTDREGDEACAFIASAVAEGKPFFLYMAHYAVHSPIQAKPELIEKYKAKKIPEGYKFNPVYAAMLEGLDQAVGKILGELDRLGVANDTVVVFTSDNGGEKLYTDNRPLRAGKGYPYEGGVREPWLFRWPGKIPANSTCDAPIITTDVLPTLCEIAGAKPPADRECDGVSLVPALTGKGKLPDRPLIWHYPHYRDGQTAPYSMIRYDGWKLIRRYGIQNQFELYHLTTDWREQHDVAQQNPDRVKKLDAMLTVELERVHAKLPKVNPDYVPGQRQGGGPKAKAGGPKKKGAAAKKT